MICIMVVKEFKMIGRIRNSDVPNHFLCRNFPFSFVFKASPSMHANESKVGGSSCIKVSESGSRVG